MTKSKLLAAALGVLVLAGSVAPAIAQQNPVPAAPASGFTKISAAERAATLDAIRAKVRELYVFPERKAAIVARLDAGQKAGRYDVADPNAFADLVSEDLRASSGDRHMYLLVDPVQYAAASAPDSVAEPQVEALFRERAERANHGLAEMRILGGNVRYLKITQFHWIDDETGQAYQDAIRFLKDGDAIIIDVRGNGGGAALAVQYLVSHFMKPDQLLLTFTRGKDIPSQSRTLGYLPEGRLTGKPLYVLTDGGSGSATEEFAYHVQQFKLGELIGQTTAGAANNNDMMPIAPGFVLSISAGRPIHAVSGTNWEAVGVKPDVEVPAEQALDVAMERALAKLAASPTATAASKVEYAWAKAEIDSRLHPVTVPVDRLRGLVGGYGPGSVTLRDGALWLARPDRPERRLSPMDDKGLFGADGTAYLRVRFTAAGLELLRPDGSPPVLLPRR